VLMCAGYVIVFSEVSLCSFVFTLRETASSFCLLM